MRISDWSSDVCSYDLYPEDNPSIGILLCKSKSKLTVEYALELVNKPMGVSTYHYRQLPKEIAQYLPDEDDFNRIIELGRASCRERVCQYVLISVVGV